MQTLHMCSCKHSTSPQLLVSTADRMCRYIREMFPHVIVDAADERFPVVPLFQITGCGTRSALIIPLASSVAGNAHFVMTALSKGAMSAVSPLQICMLRGLLDTVMASYDSVNNRAATLTSPAVHHVDTPTQQVCWCCQYFC